MGKLESIYNLVFFSTAKSRTTFANRVTSGKDRERSLKKSEECEEIDRKKV